MTSYPINGSPARRFRHAGVLTILVICLAGFPLLSGTASAAEGAGASLQSIVSAPGVSALQRPADTMLKPPKNAVRGTLPAGPSLAGATGEEMLRALQRGTERTALPAPDSTDGITAGQRTAMQRLMAGHPTGRSMRIGFGEEGKTPAFIKFDRSASKSRRGTGSLARSRSAARRFLRENRQLLGLKSPDEEMALRKEWTDTLGNTHLRFQQTIAGIPVWGREAMVHLDPEDAVYLFQGRYDPSPETLSAAVDAGITAAEAADAAAAHLGAPIELNRAARLVFHGDGDGEHTLAYQLDLSTGLNKRWIYFIDARTGAVVHRLSGIHNQITASSGADLAGRTRSFTIWSESGTDYLIDPSVPLNDPPYAPVPEIRSKGNTYILTARNGNGSSLYHVTRTSGATWDPAGVSAASSVRTVYDYYHGTFGRNGIDDNNMNYLAVVHFGQQEANAFWNGKFVVFGDGDNSTFSNLAGGLDVIAHEIQHGVTEFTAGLIYENQSGALNEGFSDIFACMVDRDDWTVGEDVTLRSPGYLRSLSNPAAGLSSLPARMSEYRNLPNTEQGDWGGVHINMSIPSRAAYLVAEGLTAEGRGTSIGREKTEQIFYRALTTYLQSSAQFTDARVATIQAAEDLYGTTEAAAVAAAWDTVEVGGSAVTPGTPDDTAPTSTDAVDGQDIMVYLYPVDDTRYQLYRQILPSPFTGYDPSLDMLLTDALVAPTKPAVYTGPGATDIYYVGDDYNLYAVYADGTGREQLTSTGDIASFAISPDGRYFAYTTIYLDDPNIYVGDLDVGEIVPHPVMPPDDLPPGEGSTINTILYADALAFDYSGKQIVFDALNCLSTPDDSCAAGGGYRYWSIGFLNLSDGTFDFPFPNQSPDFDIAYPTFAYNNSYVIALDMVDYSDYAAGGTVSSSVWTLNWKDRTSHLIVDPNQGSQDAPVYGTPSFWGDDDYLTVQMGTGSVGTAYRIPIDENWEGNAGSRERINDYDVALPVMHRAGVRSITGSIQPSAWSLSFAGAGQSLTRELTLTNNGNRDIRITRIEITGSPTFTHNGINTLLPQGESMVIRVTHRPDGSTAFPAATLNITSDAETSEMGISLTTAPSGGLVTLPTGSRDLGLRAVIHTVNGPIDAVWKKGGEAQISVGTLIWGYYYADPAQVSWGNPNNPDMFVKILISPDESWVNINYFHVSVPDIEVFTDYPYDGTADGHDTATGPESSSLRFVEHTFINGALENKPTVQYENGAPPAGDFVTGNPSGYTVSGNIKIGAVIHSVSESDFTTIVPIEGIWKKGGEADIGVGTIVWGYFHADPTDVSWGNPENPDLFVKLLIGDGYMIANYFHVSAPDIEAFADYNGDGMWENGATANLGNRFIEYRY